jgi:ethanolamine utilization microcompartment shell protein EutL
MELRTYVLIDAMQPQFAALTGILLQGDVPVEGMAEVFMELAPASDVYEVLDTALKTADVRPGLLRVEREYGTLEIHSAFQEAVQVAGQNANPYEAQLVNQTSRGGLLLAGQTLCVLEIAPAAYVWLAANEAEKASNITLVNYQPSGRYGRLYIAGSDSEVMVGREAAVQAIKGI